MIKEWKTRQALYHKLNNEHTDDLNKIKVEFSKDIIEICDQNKINLKIYIRYLLFI